MTRETITFDRLVRWIGIGLLVLGILLLVNYLSSVLLPFFIAWFFAYLLYPIVKFVERHMHLPRALSIILTLIVVIAVISGIVYLIVPPMIEQLPSAALYHSRSRGTTGIRDAALDNVDILV